MYSVSDSHENSVCLFCLRQRVKSFPPHILLLALAWKVFLSPVQEALPLPHCVLRQTACLTLCLSFLICKMVILVARSQCVPAGKRPDTGSAQYYCKTVKGTDLSQLCVQIPTLLLNSYVSRDTELNLSALQFASL